MTPRVSRRRALALGVAALAGCLSNPREDSDPTRTADPTDTATRPPETTTAHTTESGCETLVAPEWGIQDRNPSVPLCPERPDTLDACSARAFALGVEKHIRYANAIERFDQISMVSFNVYTATVTDADWGFVVSARVYFSVDAATRTPGTDGATQTPETDATAATGATTVSTTGVPDIYTAGYLVTPNGQWRAADPSASFRTPDDVRQEGSRVLCPDSGGNGAI